MERSVELGLLLQSQKAIKVRSLQQIVAAKRGLMPESRSAVKLLGRRLKALSDVFVARRRGTIQGKKLSPR